jgi:hypothetical protein
MKYIQLTKNARAIVDDDDYLEVAQHKWMLSSRGYAVRSDYIGKIDGKYTDKTVCMHRQILGAPDGLDVDHKNGDKLDNRRENIRVCTRSFNLANIHTPNGSKLLPRGVTLNSNSKSRKKYVVRVHKDRRLAFIGYFNDIHQASSAYISKKAEIYGALV